MRKKGIIILLVFAGIYIALSLLLTDRWFERRLENMGSSMVGAKVEVDGFHFSLFKMTVRWDSLQITDPKNTWTNLIAMSKSEFKMDALPLLRKKVIVENVQMTGLRTGVKRSTDGKIEIKIEQKKPEPEKPSFISKTVQRLQTDVARAPAWNLEKLSGKVNVDSILTLLQLKSPAKIDSMKNDLQNRYAGWEKTFTEKKFQVKINQIESQVKAINPQSLNTVAEVQNALTTAKQVKTEIDSLQQWVKTTKGNLANDLSTMRGTVAMADDWIRRDYERAMEMAHLPDINVKTIGKFIFGAKTAGQVQQILGYAATARYYGSKFKSSEPKKVKPPRFKGQFIHFPLKQPVPDFWIKNIHFSGRTEAGIQLDGQVQDIVSQQSYIGKPTVFAINGSRTDKAALELKGEFNYLAQPHENFSFTLSDVPLAHSKLAESPLMPYPLAKGSGTFKTSAEIGSDQLTFAQSFQGTGLEFDFSGKTAPASQMDKIVQSVLSSASTVTFNAGVKSSEENTDFSLNSNLDDLFVGKLRSLLSDKVQDARNRLQQQVTARVTQGRAALSTLITEKEAALQKEVAGYEQMVADKTQMVEQKKKELEKRIDEQKKGIQDEATKKLKKLF
jgi:uncharacterized protein (TIGR03545 family)